MSSIASVSIAEWFGIAGFLLSLFLAILEFRRQYTSLRLDRPELYPLCGALSGKHAFFRAILVNRSSLSVAVSGMEIALPEFGEETLSAELGEHVLLGVTVRKSKTQSEAREELRSTPLPINLNPYESREIVVYFSRLSPSIQQFLRPLWERSHQESEAGRPNPSVKMRVHLVTSRRPVDAVLFASVCDFEPLQEEMRKTASVRA